MPLTEDMICWPQVSVDPSAQHRYETMRRNGESHGIAEVLATRAFPGVRTDSTFHIGNCNGSQFEDCPAIGDHYKSVAEAHGVNTVGKTYISQIADFPGDPAAWVSGRGDIERVCRERGFQCEGAVTVHSGPREPTPSVRIDPKIVHRDATSYMEANPGTRYGDAYERMEEIRGGYTGRTDFTPDPEVDSFLSECIE